MNQQQQNLQDHQQAQGILQRYAGVLGIAENAASVQTGQALRSIQSALLQTDVDTDAIEQQARAVFEQLQAAQDSGADADFQTLLNDMDSFIRKVQDYAVLKASGDALKNQINSMAADRAQDTETGSRCGRRNWSFSKRQSVVCRSVTAGRSMTVQMPLISWTMHSGCIFPSIILLTRR
jgi:hypothetical protein